MGNRRSPSEGPRGSDVTEPAATILLKNLTSEGLHAALAPLGVSPRVARQLQAAAVRRDALPEALQGVSAALMARIRGHVALPRLTLREKRVSATDAFAKYLFTGDGDEPFEAVRIPLLHRADDLKYVVCVSSQVGCALGCAFCATGRLGFRRQLAAWEIVDQVIQVQADSPHPVRGIVCMGMGEPFLNYDAVITAARVCSEPCGLAIGAKAITISTAGIVPGIRRFTQERQPYRLVVSLTAADPARRRELMPVEEQHPLPEVLDALRAYHAASRQRVTLAWTMIAGVNTGAEDARQLAALTHGLPIKLDLIDVNGRDSRFQPPSDDERNRFRDALRATVGVPVARRYSGGSDIDAACGMLAAGGVCPPT